MRGGFRPLVNPSTVNPRALHPAADPSPRDVVREREEVLARIEQAARFRDFSRVVDLGRRLDQLQRQINAPA